MGWLDARKAVRDMGGLPPHVLHDHTFVHSDAWLSLEGTPYCPAWAREVIAHPEAGSVFRKGRDLVDGVMDARGREWVLPASCIPDEAMGRKDVGLFINPGAIETCNGKVVVMAEPGSVIVLTGFAQKSGTEGKADPETRVPIEVPQQELNALDRNEVRALFRADEAGVRPIVRYVFDFDGAHDVVIDCLHDARFGVGFVAQGGSAPA
ncbi:MAG: hypothetical protein KGH72_04540 [Candidatus Micrarchaeota archaeon]|nr:hypothetical protein [Candidatus Micrarchaeota archaeon]